jgi:hypothetical protein
MSADETDLDTVSKGISLTHKNKGIEVSSNADNKMAKKDKASESIKKEFTHQMDFTNTIGEEEQPKAVVAKHSIKS